MIEATKAPRLPWKQRTVIPPPAKSMATSASPPHAPAPPPPDPRLSQLCPTPACLPVIVQANTFVHERLAGQLAADCTPLFTSAAYRQNREALIVALAEGNLEATKTVCREWCKLVIGWTQQQQRAEAQARPTSVVGEEGMPSLLRNNQDESSFSREGQ